MTILNAGENSLESLLGNESHDTQERHPGRITNRPQSVTSVPQVARIKYDRLDESQSEGIQLGDLSQSVFLRPYSTRPMLISALLEQTNQHKAGHRKTQSSILPGLLYEAESQPYSKHVGIDYNSDINGDWVSMLVLSSLGLF